MATYVKASDTDPLHVEPKPICNAGSRFDADGFPLPVGDDQPRRWVPLWGGPCTTCGSPC
jgi:hypothetical protein